MELIGFRGMSYVSCRCLKIRKRGVNYEGVGFMCFSEFDSIYNVRVVRVCVVEFLEIILLGMLLCIFFVCYEIWEF